MKIERYPEIKYDQFSIVGNRDQYYKNRINAEIAADEVIMLDDGQSGTTLDARITANASYTREFTWSITKSANPTQLNLSNGGTGTSQYTITVTKSQTTTDKAVISGVVTVINMGSAATEGLKIVAKLTKSPSMTVINSVNVDVSSNPVLDPGETGNYPYSLIIPTASIEVGAVYKVTADVTITNHSGHLGTPFGPSPSATATLLEPTLVNDSITVTDTNPGSGPYTFSASGTETYSVEYECPDDNGTHMNTATIEETGQKASASVTVNCSGDILKVSKDAKTTLTRTFNWNITKSAEPDNITLSVGGTAPVNYAVTVNETPVDSDWAVNGTITIQNVSGSSVTINKITDIISPDNIPANVVCNVTFPFTLAAGATLTCSYSANLPNGNTRLNEATVTIQVGAATIDIKASAVIDFSKAVINVEHECVKVQDTLQGELSPKLCVTDQLPKTFNYTRTIGPFESCGDFEVVNTASVRDFNSNVLLAQATNTVNVHIPCRGLIIKAVI
ncbi:hypothetical protein Ccar_17395 [Clostridium carboxidivorans P7]|uniref:Uncharacterized protein n=1 Tax=Clostridium carboxidivorans P7 TaxID=536227 RepID=C6PW13_9CLOT|nr:hypothetical protein [Clostridium carboxidivorans]AKN32538.1 hypothetical protein Ccar_17395 [Clostridium carboxidivorans P7]EET86560.1 hypothetical protein CcarbDRAFT_2980 [Clostridium carboxidivorans P7]EFG87734.1 hypothetical protein CLCAR_2585 [Clostridium carboxidivorans P7]